MDMLLSGTAFWQGYLVGGVCACILFVLVFHSMFWPRKEDRNERPRYR